jgi:hypothetical protein
MADIIFNSPNSYFTDEELTHFRNLLEQNGLTTDIEEVDEDIIKGNCFDIFLTLPPEATEILLNTLIYPAVSAVFSLIFASVIDKLKPPKKTNIDSMAYLSLETEKGKVISSIPCDKKAETTSRHFDSLNQALKLISPQPEELIFDIDDGLSQGKIITLNEYVNKSRAKAEKKNKSENENNKDSD